ncbi:hypothetical protein IFM89_007237 [Coptis chinensis]|uniref:Helicase ATP-binding domain-containing protein n=1 Tax=Coptis chinensis TaxID=261450 RepID=A0A835ILN5_9MAGN|nr:hypothetical protein IFM89_007237 [Coptis chinensis]
MVRSAAMSGREKERGRRDYRGTNLRDKLERRHSPQRRYSPGRDFRGRQALHSQKQLSYDRGYRERFKCWGLYGYTILCWRNHTNVILADEMGLGKTVQFVSTLGFLQNAQQIHGPFLVVVPLSTLSNWAKEFKK